MGEGRSQRLEEASANSQPLVSVVMSVFNGEPYVAEAIDSILGQTFEDFEFIVIDDGSYDGTLGILKGYHDKRLKIVAQENAGLAKALNRAIDMAAGLYIARQDADDVSLPRRFEKQIDYLEKHPDVVVLGTSAIRIDAEGKLIEPCSAKLGSEVIKRALYSGSSPLWHGSVVMRAEALRAVGAYRAVLDHAEDFDLWLRISELGEIENLPDFLYKQRLTATRATSAHFIRHERFGRWALDCARARRNHEPEPRPSGLDAPPTATELFSMHLFKGKEALTLNDYRTARCEFRLAFRQDSRNLKGLVFLLFALLLGPIAPKIWKLARRLKALCS